MWKHVRYPNQGNNTAANQGGNTVSVAQGGSATPGATKQLLPPDRVFKRNIYLIYFNGIKYYIEYEKNNKTTKK